MNTSQSSTDIKIYNFLFIFPQKRIHKSSPNKFYGFLRNFNGLARKNQIFYFIVLSASEF